jgi:hypothetical protein
MNLTKPPRLAIHPTGTTVDASGAHTGGDIQVLPANPLRIGLILANANTTGGGPSQYYVNFGGAAVYGGSSSIIIPTNTTLIIRGAIAAESVHVNGNIGRHYTVKEIV